MASSMCIVMVLGISLFLFCYLESVACTHHCIALLTSSRLLSKKDIQNQNIIDLAKNIYNSQHKEIDFMKSFYA